MGSWSIEDAIGYGLEHMDEGDVRDIMQLFTEGSKDHALRIFWRAFYDIEEDALEDWRKDHDE